MSAGVGRRGVKGEGNAPGTDDERVKARQDGLERVGDLLLGAVRTTQPTDIDSVSRRRLTASES